MTAIIYLFFFTKSLLSRTLKTRPCKTSNKKQEEWIYDIISNANSKAWNAVEKHYTNKVYMNIIIISIMLLKKL